MPEDRKEGGWTFQAQGIVGRAGLSPTLTREKTGGKLASVEALVRCTQAIPELQSRDHAKLSVWDGT